MNRWVALLRGVNVGGGNKLPMADLRTMVEEAGYERVRTYIQSGNVVFDDAEGRGADDIANGLRSSLRREVALDVPVVVRSAGEFVAVGDRHPDRVAIEPRWLHVAFLDRAPRPARVGDVGADAFGAERWWLDGRELYLTYPDGSARSKMTIDRFERAWDVSATARNLNTVARLIELIDADRADRCG